MIGPRCVRVYYFTSAIFVCVGNKEHTDTAFIGKFSNGCSTFVTDFLIKLLYEHTNYMQSAGAPKRVNGIYSAHTHEHDQHDVPPKAAAQPTGALLRCAALRGRADAQLHHSFRCAIFKCAR